MKKEQIQTMEIITQLLDRTHVNCTIFAFHTVRIYMVPASENERAIEENLHILKNVELVNFISAQSFVNLT